jgi:hypothetical protein
VKRLLISIIAALALAVSTVGAVAAAPPAQASCVGQLVQLPEPGPPGRAQSVFHWAAPSLGYSVRYVARADASSQEECFAAFLEAYELFLAGN